MVIPVATSRLLARSFLRDDRRARPRSGSRRWSSAWPRPGEWELAPGGAIVLTAVAAFAVTATAAGVARRTGAGPVFPGA